MGRRAHLTALGVLIPMSGIKPTAPLHWKHQFLTTGLPGKTPDSFYLTCIFLSSGNFQDLFFVPRYSWISQWCALLIHVWSCCGLKIYHIKNEILTLVVGFHGLFSSNILTCLPPFLQIPSQSSYLLCFCCLCLKYLNSLDFYLFSSLSKLVINHLFF